jgi:hypothetical protein
MFKISKLSSIYLQPLMKKQNPNDMLTLKGNGNNGLC